MCNTQTGVISNCGQVVEACVAGCASMDSPSGGGVHCKRMIASNGVSFDDVTGADSELVLLPNTLYTFNTDTGEIRQYTLPVNGPGVMVRAAGTGLDAVSHIRYRNTAAAGTTPGLGVFGFLRLTVPSGAVVRPIAPMGGRAAVLVASDAISISGDVDVSAGRAQTALGNATFNAAGPGGGRGGFDATNGSAGCAGGGPGVNAAGANETGGGGGGLGTAGGKGGPQSAGSDMGGSAVAMGMLAASCPQTALTPLRGGSGGGIGGAGGAGGGGGGAMQITSFRAISLASGRLIAGGAGGEAGGGGDGGGGGGAGGGILLEAPIISIVAGALTAGGGGGGAGNGGTDGENAHPDGTVALGGAGTGGDGATGTSAANGEVIAETGIGNVDGTGGGGGGAGIIHVRSIATPAMMSTPVIRPMASTSTATSQ